MSKQVSNQKTHFTNTLHRTVTIDGLSIFYRESGQPTNPKLVLLHGWPSSSHQYRNLIPALADHFHIVAPDYPGFGNSDLPSTKEFSYTFDRLSEIIEEFLKAIGFTHFGLFVQDYGGPVGFRIIARHPDWLEWLIIQNTNAYEVGFTKAWDGFRNALWKEHKAMLAHCKELLKYQNGQVAIHTKHNKLLISLRTAVENGEGSLDKETTSHDDLFDSFRLSLIFWH